MVPVLPPPPETIRNKRKKKYGRLIDHSMYNIIKIYPGKYGIKSFIFLMDREHYKSLEKIKEYLRTNLHVRIKDVKELGKSAFIITCGFAHHEITIYTAILGKVKCIEEEIAKLIELELNIKCKPEKKEIKKILRNHRLKIEDLIERASKEHLEKAFPGLTTILRFS